MEFVAFLGNDKENWGQISALVNRIDQAKIFLVKDKAVKDFPTNEKCVVVEIDSSLPLLKLKQQIQEKLKPLLSKEFEVAVSIASGSGKDHMALIAALLALPVGIKIVAYTKEGIEFIT
jgi:hypothetical protein